MFSFFEGCFFIYNLWIDCILQYLPSLKITFLPKKDPSFKKLVIIKCIFSPVTHHHSENGGNTNMGVDIGAIPPIIK